MPTNTGAGDSLVFNLLQRTAARALWWLHTLQAFMPRPILFSVMFKTRMVLLTILRPFILEFIPAGLQSWADTSSVVLPHIAMLRKSSDCSRAPRLSWMACLYGRFCHQSWYYEHSHCYCLTIVNQLKTNRGVPEKYFISCNETGLQSCIWLPDWKDYKEQWFWTLRHFFSDLYAHRVRQMKILCSNKLRCEYIFLLNHLPGREV